MKNYPYYLLPLLVFPFFLSAQQFEEELKSAIKERPKLDVRFDSRHSFINQSGVRVFGIKLGLQFDNKLSFGIGYNQLNSTVKNEIDLESISYNVKLRFYNFSPYVEYVFYRDERWELSIPVQFGFGSSYYANQEDFGAAKIHQKFVVSYEPAITFQYRFLKYFGAGLGVGYRLMVKGNPEVEEQFTSPVYILKSKIYFQDLWQDIKGK